MYMNRPSLSSSSSFKVSFSVSNVSFDNSGSADDDELFGEFFEKCVSKG